MPVLLHKIYAYQGIKIYRELKMHFDLLSNLYQHYFGANLCSYTKSYNFQYYCISISSPNLDNIK